jgi:hypothetical protein
MVGLEKTVSTCKPTYIVCVQINDLNTYIHTSERINVAFFVCFRFCTNLARTKGQYVKAGSGNSSFLRLHRHRLCPRHRWNFRTWRTVSRLWSEVKNVEIQIFDVKM